MTTGTINEAFAEGNAHTQSLFVGPHSKFIAGIASIVAYTEQAYVYAQLHILGRWIQISENLPLSQAPALIPLRHELEGNLPAGAEIRLAIRGDYEDISVFMMTS